jgi:hypothetical protein
MPVVVGRRPGSTPSLLSSMPQSLFGKFTTNGKASDAVTKPEVTSRASKRKKSSIPALAHPKDDAVRSEPYLRLVAARPCIHCKRQKNSQAAHLPPTGKQIKQDDRETFPMCADGPRRRGCHTKFDNYELFPRDQAMKQGRKWGAQTRRAIEAEGLWPKNLAKWPKKGCA